jgi:hypothetical protein
MNTTTNALAEALEILQKAHLDGSLEKLIETVKSGKQVEAIQPERKPKIDLNNAPSGQNRRLKKKVNKLPVKERELLPEERDTIILYMNQTQNLMPHDSGEGDGVCQKMCDKFNAESPRLNRVWPYQISGYYSHLCRMAMKPKDDRENWFERAVFKGSLTGNVRPYFGVNLQRRVAANWSKARREEWERKQDHMVMASERREKGVL